MTALEFCQYIRRLRKDKGLTLFQVGAVVNLSHSYLSQIEHGQRGMPSPRLLKGLSIALGVAYHDLMVLAGYLEEESSEKEFIPRNLELSNLLDLPEIFYKDKRLSPKQIHIVRNVLDALIIEE